MGSKMVEYLSVYQRLGIPDGFGVAVAVFSLSLALVPYLAGKNIGPIVIPDMNVPAKRRLRIGGPLLLVLSLALFFPLVPVHGESDFLDVRFETAHALYESDDFEEAFPIFNELARDGNAFAMFYVGRAYKRGRHVDENREAAAKWFAEALPRLKKGAKQGDTFSMYYLGRMYSNGYGTPKSKEKARFWYRKASDDGYAKAMYRIAEIYDDQQRYEKALEWYEKALTAGDIQARGHINRIRRILGRDG